MLSARRKGFTLIELLVVIAIIAILSAMTFAVLPRVRERGKLTQLQGIFHGIDNALALYASRKGDGSYPPIYGYVRPTARGKVGLVDADYFNVPYGSFIELNKAKDIYDNFGSTADSNNDGNIGLLEYSPIGRTDVSTGVVKYPLTLYKGDPSVVPDEISAQMKSKEVPVRYIPVNLAQFKRAKRFWIENAKDPLARTWNVNAPEIKNMHFPPAKYDAYVLISVGPREDSFGVLADPPQGAPPKYATHIAALRTYFLATRDLNQDNISDFDYEQANVERKLTYTVTLPPPSNITYEADNLLPSAKQPAGYGPKIWVP